MDRSRSTATALALALAAAYATPADLLAQDVSTLPPGATTGGSRPFLAPASAEPLMAQVYQLEIPPLIDRPLGLERDAVKQRVGLSSRHPRGHVSGPADDDEVGIAQ